MNGLGSQIVTNVGIHLDDGVSIDLRGSLEAKAFLTIGNTVEIMLGESHIRALRAQFDEALGDMASVEAADRALDDAYEAGAQAHTAAVLARAEAEAARRAGAEEQAVTAEEAADRALQAAERVQVAVQVAVDAMECADDAAERARMAARTAQSAVG